MSQGRGSAVAIGMVVAMVAMAVVFQGGVAEAATYTVGDAGGWTFNVAGWPKGKTFKAGDTLGKSFNCTPLAYYCSKFLLRLSHTRYDNYKKNSLSRTRSIISLNNNITILSFLSIPLNTIILDYIPLFFTH